MRYTSLLHCDRDDVTGHDGIMRDVVMVSHDQLQRVRSRRKRQRRLGLSGPEMTVLIISRKRRHRIDRLLVDQQMMMSRILFLDTRRGYPHSDEAKFYGHRSAEHRTVLRFDKIHLGACR